MSNGKTVKLVTETNEMVIQDIEEYVCGFSYFYVRYTDGKTTSFDRRNIIKALRKLPTGDFRQIHLKKPKAQMDSEQIEETCGEE
jgi:hypothetical protein